MDVVRRILVVEDGPGEREALARVLRLEGYEVLTAENPQAALEYVDQQVDLVLSDLRMGKTSGLDLLRFWGERRPHTPFIMVTAYGDVDSAVTAMKLGARDYLTKPIDPAQLLALIRQTFEEQAAPADVSPPVFDGQRGLDRVIGRSPAMLEVYDQTLRAAQTESTVLILGESGTGKELIAEAIYDNSPRRDGPLVVVNMAAIPDTLVESELFGHVRGAFTGATNDRVGRFETANGGTIFIDEIGDFPPASQAKLLRVLENRTIVPVGGNERRAINVRVVAATSRDLVQMVGQGRFRADLYYRLNVLVVHLPPLRQRREDVPLLVDYFLKELCLANRLPQPQVSSELMSFLEQHPWPGNVRQLRNCLESMVVMAKGSLLTLDDLPRNLEAAPAAAREAVAAPSTLGDVARSAILHTLRQHQGNRTRAAEALGISVRTLQRRLKEWGLQDEPIT